MLFTAPVAVCAIAVALPACFDKSSHVTLGEIDATFAPFEDAWPVMEPRPDTPVDAGEADAGPTEASGGPDDAGLVNAPVVTGNAPPPSHFHIVFADVNVTVDCTQLDQQATGQALRGLLYGAVGGTSASTGQGFLVTVPLTANRLRQASLLTSYPMIPWNPSRVTVFELALNVLDGQRTPWTSCAPGQCGLPDPDPNHHDTITAIIEESKDGGPDGGTASFRIEGTYAAVVTADGSTTPATGDWSILVTVPDPGALDCSPGCIDRMGTCQSGTSDSACGTMGQTCQPCAQPQACVNQACVVPSSSGDAGVADSGTRSTCTAPCAGMCCGTGQVCIVCPPGDAGRSFTMRCGPPPAPTGCRG